MKVTIIIPNYNGKHFMEPCLASLNEQTCRDFKILIVDNASTDGSLEYMEQTYPDIEVLALDSNYGFSRAVNEGIRHADTPYVILLNNDTTVDSRYVEEMIRAIEVSDRIFCEQQDDPDVSPRSDRQRRRSLYLDGLGGMPWSRTTGFELHRR